ncbi:hypothetical protein [Hyphobacterium sp.]|uniref:hypothetical protein n=1 Tax=Hyphobacterium sp. TaxID=2004662 RepID=UPI003BA9D1F4
MFLIISVYLYSHGDFFTYLAAIPPSGYLGALVIGYALGVLFNILGSFVSEFAVIPYSLKDKDRHKRIQKAVEKTFNTKPDKDSWRLCLGIMSEHGYGAKIGVFSNLNVFCQSMMVVLFLCTAVSVVQSAFLTGFSVLSIVEASTLLLAGLVFLYGANIYSRYFSRAIYEAFYSWYCDPERGRHTGS